MNRSSSQCVRAVRLQTERIDVRASLPVKQLLQDAARACVLAASTGVEYLEL